MINATDLKGGTTFLFEEKPYQVVKYEHQKIGRGGATVKVSMRNLSTGQLEAKTFNGQVKFDEITTLKKRLQYLYNDGDVATFMDPSNYSQTEISIDVLGDSLLFIKEGSDVDVLFWDETAISVDIPPKVTLKVTETEPGHKGNSATNVYKPATLENGLEVKVPLFVKNGDKIRIDTRTSEYVERVND